MASIVLVKSVLAKRFMHRLRAKGYFRRNKFLALKRTPRVRRTWEAQRYLEAVRIVRQCRKNAKERCLEWVTQFVGSKVNV